MNNRELKIATATTRTATTWENTFTTKQDLTAAIYDPIVVNIKTHTYHSTNKRTRDHFKDVGGYVGGHLKDGKRKKGHVLTRSFITLDADNTPTDVDIIAELTKLPFAWLAHTTLSHTPETPRWRIIIWLTRDVTPDEYEAISRRIAQDICPGLTWFDPTTFQPERMMYNAAVLKDNQDYRAEVSSGKPDLDPDGILARYTDWHDVTTWPGVNTQHYTRHNTRNAGVDTSVENPLSKKGLIGAFNRAHSITDVIQNLIPGIYVPGTTKDRWTYAQGTSVNGLITYNNDTFAYSNHATDPASGMLLNAFDLARVHKFGDLDTDTPDNVPNNKTPSYVAMMDYAQNDPQTRKENAQTQLAAVHELFKPIEHQQPAIEQAASDATTSNTPATTPDAEVVDPTAWVTDLTIKKNGSLEDSYTNFYLILTNDPRYQTIAWNEHSNQVEVRDPELLPWKQLTPGWSDTDLAMLKQDVAARYGGIYAPTKLFDALVAAAATRAWHPVRTYFTHLPAWDGIPRLDTLLVDYLGAEDSKYMRAITRKPFVAAVVRTFKPGTKFDYVLTIKGPQGAGKSSLLAKLGGPWFTDNITLQDMRDKTAAEKLQGNLICELAELAGLRKTDAESIKAFITRREDKYRPAYGRHVVNIPRQNIFIGTTNVVDGFLRDPTGGRRWWIAEITGKGILDPLKMTDATRDQIWAEALHYAQQGEPLWLEGDILDEATDIQADNIETDERAGLVAEYLDKPIPQTWDTIPLSARRIYLDGGTLPDHYANAGTFTDMHLRETVSKIEIWCECFGRDGDGMSRKDSFEISAIMQQIPGWVEKGKRKRLELYGRQRVFERTPVLEENRKEKGGTKGWDNHV